MDYDWLKDNWKFSKLIISHKMMKETLCRNFKNGFTLKALQMFSVHTTPMEFKNAPITGQFGFVFKENWGREIT